jgi:glutamate synthase domain-containing protein 3
MVELIKVTERSDRDLLRRLLEEHARYTGSARAKRELGRWKVSQAYFIAVVPREYRQALERESGAVAATAIVGAAMGSARHA